MHVRTVLRCLHDSELLLSGLRLPYIPVAVHGAAHHLSIVIELDVVRDGLKVLGVDHALDPACGREHSGWVWVRGFERRVGPSGSTRHQTCSPRSKRVLMMEV